MCWHERHPQIAALDVKTVSEERETTIWKLVVARARQGSSASCPQLDCSSWQETPFTDSLLSGEMRSSHKKTQSSVASKASSEGEYDPPAPAGAGVHGQVPSEEAMEKAKNCCARARALSEGDVAGSTYHGRRRVRSARCMFSDLVEKIRRWRGQRRR